MKQEEWPLSGVFGVQLRMMPALIKNNGTGTFGFLKQRVKLYCLTLTIEDTGSHFNGFIYLDAFDSIGRNEYLNIYKTIYTKQSDSIYTAPDRLFIISSVIKCRGSLREVEAIINSARRDKEYQALADLLLSMVSETASYPVIVNIAIKISEVIKKHLGKIEDVSIATTNHYFNKHHGDLDNLGLISFNKSTMNVSFDFELITYNKSTFCIGDEMINTTFPADIYQI